MKNFTLTFVLLVMGFSVFAQKRTIEDNFIFNNFWDNWYISAGAGTNVYWGTDDGRVYFGDRIAPALDVSIGKWFHPIYGVRLQYAGLKAKGTTYGVTRYAVPGSLPDQWNDQEFNVRNFHFDGLFNISNAIGGYKFNRRFDFIPFIGFGIARSGSKENDKGIHKFTVNAGMIGKIHLSNKLDINAEYRAFYVNKDFDGEFDESPNGKIVFEGMGAFTVGLTYRFGKKKNKSFRTVASVTDEIRNSYEADKEKLEQQLKEQEAANARLNEEVLRVTKEAEEKAKEDSIAAQKELDDYVKSKLSGNRLVTVFFEIGKTNLSDFAVANLKQAAELIKNSGADVNITGFADLNTGSKRRNEQLSQQRARAVYDALVNVYHVNGDQLHIIKVDLENQPYGKPILNRAAILEFK